MRCTLGLVVALLACKGKGSAPAPEPDPDGFTVAERAQLAALSPLPPTPPDPSNKYADDPRAAALGQMLFFDRALSGPLLVDSYLGKAGDTGRVSCRTCHAGPALDDQASKPNHVSIGTAIGERNAPPILNAVFYRWGNWGGRFDSAWSLVLGATEKSDVMNGSRLAVAHTVFAKYRAEYDAVFPEPLDPALDPAAADAARFPATGKPKGPSAADGPWEQMAPDDRALIDRIYVNVGKAIAAYMRRLVARDAPFDRYVAGAREALTPAARRGLRSFLRHCASCHAGPHLQDGRFHVLGMAQFGEGVPAVDLGRSRDVVALRASSFHRGGPHSDARAELRDVDGPPATRGAFRTPTLRNVAVTAPYMHAGQLPTLAAVVAFYNVGGGRVDADNVEGMIKSADVRPLGLSPAEQAELVEFMMALTDTSVPAELLADTSR